MTFEEQVRRAAQLSKIDSTLRAQEEVFFRNKSETVPSTVSVVEARQDLASIGQRLVSWPLPLDLEYPTPRMERQLQVLQNTLELRKVESKRKYQAQLNERYQELVDRREALEDQVAGSNRALQVAESHARQEEERRQERVERRRREEEARLAREAELREEARVAGEAAEALRRQHQAEEAATEEALANVRAEGGASAFGGSGDFRMCRRCRTGPIENKACANLSTHNNSFQDSSGVRRRPNACPNRNCGWFSSNWHDWPYWDGVFGPH